MFARLLALFVIVPALELYLLIRLGTLIGAAETFGIILLTGLVGSYLAKSQGLSVWRRFQEKLSGGSVPGTELLDGVIILLSGALLITPGVLTDAIGFLGLIPFTRAQMRNYLKTRLLPAVSLKGFRGMRVDVNPGAYPNNGFNRTHASDPTGQSAQSRPNSNSNGQSTDPDIIIRGTPKKRPSGPGESPST